MYKIKLSPYAQIFYNEWALNPTSSHYNLVFDQTLYGHLNISQLREALKRYVAEHVLLNSHIQDIAGETYWVKNKHISELEYLNRLPAKYNSSDYITHTFDLHNGPLYKFQLLRLSKDVYRFIAIFHHLLVDGGESLEPGVFANIANYYNDKNHKQNRSITEQIELITALSDTLSTRIQQNAEQHKQFWQSHLGELENIDLRFLKLDDKYNSAAASTTATVKEINFSYDAAVVAKLRKIKTTYKVTPFVYGLSIFALLLYRYTSQEHFAISYPIEIKEGKDYIYGSHINTNLIPFQFSNTTRVVDLFAQAMEFLRVTIKEGIQHGYYPINNIIAHGNKQLLSVFFAQTYFRNKPFAFTGINKVEAAPELNINKDILLFEQEFHNGQLNYRVRYDTRVINELLLNNFVACYKRLFIEILEDLFQGNSDKLVTSYSLLDQAQYKQLVYDFNQTDKDYPRDKTIHQLFEEQVVKTPNNIAVVYQNIKLTYKELNERANQLAHYLLENYKIKPDDLTVLCLKSGEQILVAMLAILKSGAAYVPIEPGYPSERIKFILEDTKTKLALIDREYKQKLESLGVAEMQYDILTIGDDDVQSLLCAQSSANLNIAMTSNNLAYVMYTSATTGKPKGVVIEHRGVVSLVKNVDYINIDAADSFAQFADPGFDAATFEIWTPLLNGAKVVILNNKMDLFANIKLFHEILIKNKITILWLTKTLFDQIFLTDEGAFEGLKYLLVGGEALNKQLILRLISSKSTPQNVINGYGPTENTTFSCTFKITKDNIANVDSVPIGKPLTNRKAYVLDKSCKPLPIGAIGELHVGGEGLARGYMNRPELMAKKFIDNPLQTEEEKRVNRNTRLYKTGDLVRMLPCENLEYVGRNDFQVKIRGYRIELEEIENQIIKYPEVMQCVVLVKEYASSKYLIAYYVAETKLDEIKIKNFLLEQLPEYLMPRALVQLTQLPLTANGKLNRKALPEPEFISAVQYEAPRSDGEQLICEAFIKVLELKDVGVNDDFFAVGGNSIQAIRLASFLQANFDVKVSDIFNLRTPRRLAKALPFGKDVLKHKLEQVKLLYKQKSHKRNYVDEQLQNKLDSYYVSINEITVDGSLQKPITNVLLTGATGYLGCNLLYQLLKLTNYNIYLLVRADSHEQAVKRTEQKFQFYFDKNLFAIYGQRVSVLKSDIEMSDLGLSTAEYQNLADKIDSIIHTAALVKHYGNYDRFYAANVQATVHLLELAKLTKLKDFHYISTYSVLNFGYIPDCEEYAYTEDDLPDNLEQWQNVYVQTKLQGEHQVIQHRAQRVRANIYRVGNLAFILENYRTQENIEDNAFFHWLKCLLKMKHIARGINIVEISPVDQTAEAIVKLFDKKQLSDNTYHVFNPYLFNISDVFTSSKNSPVKTLSMKQFINSVIQNLNNNIYHDLIIRFLLHQGWLEGRGVENTTAIRVLQSKTQQILKQLGFAWTPITIDVFNKYLELLE